jgi:branched-chain amino acid transport system ATP-binding protein
LVFLMASQDCGFACVTPLCAGLLIRKAELMSDRGTPQLAVTDLDVYYGAVQVLFGVSIEVQRGDIVALLGTNGAGKSTLLKAIAGVVGCVSGSVVYEGRDLTKVAAHEIALGGVSMMPGGAAVFPTLTIAENLRVASWPLRSDRVAQRDAIASALSAFPVLEDRRAEQAASLSGGQQQMLGLAMNLLANPGLLMIDELSLGLAPVVVEHLAALVRTVANRGTTVIIVEQSVNLALTLAEKAYFIEKGEIRFSGPTKDLLERPDVLHSVFLGDALGAATSQPRPIVTRRVSPPASVTTRALEVNAVTCEFGGVRALDAVDLVVGEEEIVGLLGPNGAGKTTLMDVISGFTPITAGRVALYGDEITALAPHQRARRGIGRSFQDAALFGSMTVWETVLCSLDRFTRVRDAVSPSLRLPASQRAEARLSARARELLAVFGIESLSTRYVAELSTGTRRIVDLACAVGFSPRVLLLDEPSSGIAQRETEALGPLIHRVRDELGCAVLVIEHDMPLLIGVADRLVALDCGTVVTSGPADEVMNHPTVVSAYLGAELSSERGAERASIARSGPQAK